MGEVLALANLVALQLARIGPFWAAGILAGSLVSVFLSAAVSTAVGRMGGAKRGTGRLGPARLLLAVALGAASPVCMYGTIPILASLGRSGVPQHLLAAFMVSSVLMNPNLFVFTFALGVPIALVRLFVCFAVSAVAGILVQALFRNVSLFDFRSFAEKTARAHDARPTAGDYLRSLGRGIVKTAPYFLGGILLTALMDRYFPRQWLDSLFRGNQGLGVILAASVGVPVYVCGGGTIPLVKYWLGAGMSPGSAVAFMVSGPATKLTNLGALKIILGARNFGLYIAFCLLLAVLSGLAVDAVFGLAGRLGGLSPAVLSLAVLNPAGWRIGP